jgi:hypothetical protein
MITGLILYQVPCLPGMYCDQAQLSYPAGNCSEGYYCLLGAATPTPTDGTTGKDWEYLESCFLFRCIVSVVHMGNE